MMKSVLSAAGLLALVNAFTPPVQPPTYGSLLTPNTETPLVTGQTNTITWDPKQPADGVTVSLVLCNGPSSNCVIQGGAIVEGVPAAAGSYSWNVPCDLPEGTANTATGYGMLIIVDGTGEFQYSTQFSVQKGSSCSSSSSSSSPTGPTGPTGPSDTSSPTSSPTGTDSAKTWMGWTSSSTGSTVIDYSTPTYTYTSSGFSSHYTSAPAYSTSEMMTYAQPSTSAAATTRATSAQPSQFTGAAALPTAFVNVAGLVGAAGLAVLAL